MRKCIDSLLVGGDDVEIIVVNDGSKDNTLEIAKRYEELYPNIVKAVDKEKKEGKFTRLPERKEINQDINDALIVEYYNR